jgi:hypothetical protein
MPRAAPRPSEHFAWADWRVDDCRGQRVGTLAMVYEDLRSASPAWFLVRLGRYSSRFVLAPPAEVLSWHGRISLPWDRLRIERAPLLYEPPDAIGPAMEDELRRHYSLVEHSDVHMTARRFVA